MVQQKLVSVGYLGVGDQILANPDFLGILGHLHQSNHFLNRSDHHQAGLEGAETFFQNNTRLSSFPSC
jgi:hypothetical protein